MLKNITLNDLINELQKLQEKHGNDEVLSIGSCCGLVNGMRSPYSIRFADDSEYVPAYKNDIIR